MIVKRVKLTPEATAILRPVAGVQWPLLVERYRARHTRLYGAYGRRLEAVLAASMTEDDGIEVWLGAGKRAQDWLPDMERLIAGDGVAHGAKYLRVIGRRGWVRLLPHWTATKTGDDWTLERAIA